jgi:hypothetical protein
MKRTRASLMGHRALSSHAGKIQCPVRGESDVDRCVGCEYLQFAEMRDGVLHIQCRPIRTTMVDGEIYSALRF